MSPIERGRACDFLPGIYNPRREALPRILPMSRAPLTALAPALAFATLLAAPAMRPAHGQTVNKCMIAGHPVFQTTPCAREARPAALTIPTAPPADSAAPKKRTLADILRERDGGARADVAPPPRGDGANILRARMGAV